ncbi:MAG: hypothetical protein JWL59_1287 [Chthoniobacteraceae bacterium]|nr:hypothetical protein [Chthoniobacteraceae bacterium]
MRTIPLLFFILSATQALFAVPPNEFEAPKTVTSDYVAHEWGTFTSVQGADGVQLDWNPLNVWDLPKFVYTLNRPGLQRRNGVLVAAKSAITSRQRMETPVIYFYSKTPRTIDVGVDFPQGTITEWYPQALFPNELNPILANKSVSPPKGLRWMQVNLLPPSATPPALQNDEAGSHYYAARETDASLVSISTRGGPRETEKFLFYRGVAGFIAPLTVTSEGDNAQTLHLKNTGKEDLKSLFIYRAHEGRGSVLSVEALVAGETRTVALPPSAADQPLESLRRTLGNQLQTALTKAGLYEKESAAMVHTWDDSWLGESGIRVLYILPREWTDRTLPLTLSPSPGQVARVMVGRAEMITPAMEEALTAEVNRFSSDDAESRAQAIANTRKLDLGRFSESVLRRVITNSKPTAAFSAKSWELLQATSKK